MKKSFVYCMVFCAGLGLVAAGCDNKGMAGKESPDASEVLVTVNGAKITADRFREEAEAISPYALQMMTEGETRDKFLENLVAKELMVQQAKKDGLEKDPEIVKRLDQVRDSMLLQTYVTREIFEKAAVTDQDAKDYFEKNKDSLGSVRISHIQVGTKEEAEEVLVKFKAGASFLSLAKEFSQDAQTSGKGGDLGFIEWQQFGSPDLREAAFNTPLGEVSNVVRSSFAFHIIKVTDKKPAKEGDIDRIREALKEYMLDKRREELFSAKVESLKAASKITRNEDAIKGLASLAGADAAVPADEPDQAAPPEPAAN